MEKKGQFLKISTLNKKKDGFEYQIFLKQKTKKFLQRQYQSTKSIISYVL